MTLPPTPRKTPEEYHNRNHDDGTYPMEECSRCRRAQQKCKNKIRFWTWVEADDWVRDFNESRSYFQPVVRYWCRWCDGYHMATARTKKQLKQVEKARREWLVSIRKKEVGTDE